MELQAGSKEPLYQIMLARYYSSSLGRFMAVDPVLDVKTAMENPQGWNRYAYVKNNPILRTDPDGRCDECLGFQLDREQMAVAQGKMPLQEYNDRNAARAVGAAIGAVVAAGVHAILAVAGPALDQASQPEAPAAPAEEGAGTRSLDDPGSLAGASPDEIRGLTPGWEESDTKGAGGVRRANPDKPGEQVRMMPGNPDDPNPDKQGPYVRVSKDGKVSDPVPISRPPKPEEPKK